MVWWLLFLTFYANGTWVLNKMEITQHEKKGSRRNNIYAKCLSNRMQNRVREDISLHFLKTNNLFPSWLYTSFDFSYKYIICNVVYYKACHITQHTFLKRIMTCWTNIEVIIIGGCSSSFLSVSLLRWNETNLQFICPILFDSCYIRSFLS